MVDILHAEASTHELYNTKDAFRSADTHVRRDSVIHSTPSSVNSGFYTAGWTGSVSVT
jgi:hypothetical protein